MKTKKIPSKGRKKAPQRGKTKPRTKAPGSIMLTALAIGATGILSYLGWQYIQKRKKRNSPNLDEALLKNGVINPIDNTTSSGSFIDSLSPLPGTSTTPPYIPDSIINNAGSTIKGGKKVQLSADSFPLKRGSKGDNVRQLQQALINKYGGKTLPKYGADGDFGSETVAALKKLKMPATISETLFNVLTQNISTATEGNTMSSLAQKIYAAVLRKDFKTVLSLLKNITSSTDYSEVSEAFKQNRVNGVRQTLVNGLLNVFSTDAQKQQLRLSFATMGLTYDGNKWSLSGIEGLPIVTIVPAKIWVNAATSVTVPARMVLGHEIARRMQFVLFSNNGRQFLVHADCIKHL